MNNINSKYDENTFSLLKDYLNSLALAFGIPEYECSAYHEHEQIFRFRVGCNEHSTQNLYYVYSATKPITCTAVMQLVERGLLQLSDCLDEYIPAFSNMQVKTDTGLVKAESKITVEQLLAMTAGFSYDLKAPCICEAVAKTPQADTATIVNALATAPLDFHPGTHFQYSLCHDILAVVVEVITGLRFGEYVRKNIFEPLGIKDAYYIVSEDIKERIKRQYRYVQLPNNHIEIARENDFVFTPQYESAGAGLLCSVDDYILFADAIACGGVGKNGNRIIRPETIDKMKENKMFGVLQEDFDLQGWQGYGYGLGMRTLIDDRYSEGPLGEFGWAGTAGSYVLMDTENKLSLFYAQHIRDSAPLQHLIHPRLRDIFYKCLK